MQTQQYRDDLLCVISEFESPTRRTRGERMEMAVISLAALRRERHLMDAEAKDLLDEANALLEAHRADVAKVLPDQVITQMLGQSDLAIA